MPSEINGCMFKWLHILSGSVPSSAWPAGPASPVTREDDISEVQDREQSQQSPLGSREAENAAELRASDNEEEPRDSDGYVTHEVSLQSVISYMQLTQDFAKLLDSA